MTPMILVTNQDAEKATSGYLAQARAFKINSQEDYALVDSHCKAGLELKKKIEADFDESKGLAHAAWKSIVAQEKGHLDGIEEGRKYDKSLLIAWDDAQARLRVIEEARLRAEATKLAEDEALAKAERAAEFGDDKAADAIMSAPVVVAPVVLPPAPKSQTVISTRWGAVVGGQRLDGTQTDPKFVLNGLDIALKAVRKATPTPGIELLEELLERIIQDAKYMVYDTVALNRQATATKDNIKLGGVAFVSRRI